MQKPTDHTVPPTPGQLAAQLTPLPVDPRVVAALEQEAREAAKLCKALGLGTHASCLLPVRRATSN